MWQQALVPLRLRASYPSPVIFECSAVDVEFSLAFMDILVLFANALVAAGFFRHFPRRNLYRISALFVSNRLCYGFSM